MKRDKVRASADSHNSSSSSSNTKANNVNRCKICSKVFTYGNDLRKHLRIHSDERPFPCEHCGQRFRQAGCLKNHIASQHGGPATFSCYYCSKAFPIKERLRLHMRIHSGEKPYRCERCERSFSRGGQLKQHMVTHIDCRTKYLDANEANATSRLEQPTKDTMMGLKCAFCGESFARRLQLKIHTKDCDKRTKNHLPTNTNNDAAASGLERPRPRHTFDCDMCDSSFLQHSQLKVHKRMHSGERPYKCQVCWHSFAHSSVLKLHIRKHTGEKPFKCVLCPDTSFSQLPHLKTHMRTIHGMDKTYQCFGCRTFYKTKNELQLHSSVCEAQTTAVASTAATTPTTTTSEPEAAQPAASPEQQAKQQMEKLTQMRLCVAVLLKRITTGERLKELGFEKVLIDNVIMAALKKADQPYEADAEMTELERFCVNVRYFLEWTIPKNILDRFEHKHTNVKELLVKLTQKPNDRCQ